MPSFSYIQGEDRTNLIAYIQCLGGKDGVKRATQQAELKVNLIKYYQKGPGENVAYLNSTMPSDWLNMPNPEPVTVGSVERGARPLCRLLRGLSRRAWRWARPVQAVLEPAADGLHAGAGVGC